LRFEEVGMKSSAMKIDRPDRPATYTDLGALPKNVVGEIVAGSRAKTGRRKLTG